MGYHIYSRKNLAMSNGDVDRYVAMMRQDLSEHYAGARGFLFVRTFTPRMQAWVEPYARHVFQEFHLAAAVVEVCAKLRDAADIPGSIWRVTGAIWARFPELDALPELRRAARWRHLEVLVAEQLASMASG